MRIIFDESDVAIVAKAMAKSPNLVLDFDQPYAVTSPQADIYTEACRVVAALRRESERQALLNYESDVGYALDQRNSITLSGI